MLQGETGGEIGVVRGHVHVQHATHRFIINVTYILPTARFRVMSKASSMC